MAQEARANATDLWTAYKEHRDPAAREALILEYAYMVKYVAGRVAIGLPPHVDSEDLYSYGIFGLIDAIEKFDPARGYKFETYAITRIRGSMLDGLRAMDWVPASLRQKGRRVEHVFWELEARYGRSPSEEEMAEALGWPLEEVHQVLSDLSYSALLSLNEVWMGEDSDEGEFNLLDLVPDDDAADPLEGVRINERERILADAIDQLPERERLVISLYYFEGLTATEISRIMNLSVSRISQLHGKALLRLRGRLGRQKEALL